MPKYEHGGHRQRLRNRAEKYGIGSLEDHELLELLLFYTIPRVNTNSIAHRLIDRFGSLENVFKASVEDLIDAGLTSRSAYWLHSVPFYVKSYRDHFLYLGSISKSKAALQQIIRQRTENLPHDMILEICVDAGFRIFSQNVLKAVPSDPGREIKAICTNAAMVHPFYVVLVHTRLEGDEDPTEYDCCMTELYHRALQNIGTTLYDRYHATPSTLLSYKEVGAFFDESAKLYSSKYYDFICSTFMVE